MESISNVKVATNLKKEAKKVQRQKTFFFAQIPPGFIQCSDMTYMSNLTKFWLRYWRLKTHDTILLFS